MRKLLSCGLVLMLMSVLIPHTICSGYDAPVLKVSEWTVEQAFIPATEKNFSAIICLHDVTEKTGHTETGPVTKFHNITDKSKHVCRSRPSVNTLTTGFA